MPYEHDESNIFDDMSDRVWETALKDIKDYIVAKIRSKSSDYFVSYSELSNLLNAKVDGLTLDGEGYNPILWRMVGALSEREFKAGRGMLSALVVHKSGDKQPGRGFFTWAKELGYDFDDDDIFWWKEVAKVCAAYGRRTLTKREFEIGEDFFENGERVHVVKKDDKKKLVLLAYPDRVQKDGKTKGQLKWVPIPGN